ncbi:MAG: Flp family type IVb pilin [Chloroflexi bacterium]|nr:Flp family type IVb pilin [Chloroflexota bacterium]
MVLSQFIQADRWINRHAASEKGQGLVEYALVLVLVAVVVIAILTLLGPQIGNVFSRILCGLNESCP